MRGLSTGLLGKIAILTPPTAGLPMDVAFLVPEARDTMTGQSERLPASTPTGSGHTVIRVLLLQLGLSVVVAMLFWGLKGYVSGYSALLGGLTCVIPNAFLALRLTVPRQDPGAGALMRAAYVGELGKLALTIIMFIMVFSLVRPLAAGALFAGFIAAQLATFAGFLMREEPKNDSDERDMELKSNNNGE
jgi:ATP synthase protein I